MIRQSIGSFLALTLALGAACSASNDKGNHPTVLESAPEGAAGAGGESPAIVFEGSAGGPGGAPAGSSCKVTESEGDAIPQCEQKAPAGSFKPVVQWQWTPPPASPTSLFSGS